MTNENTSLDRVNRWIKNSVTLKLLTIGILILILLIPSSMIQSIIRERESLSMSTIYEVSSKWAEEQTISGPVISIPLIYEYQNKVKKEGSDEMEIVVYKQVKSLTLLPKDLYISGNVSPRKLRRGIYEIVVYESSLQVKGNFDLNLNIDEVGLKEIQWDKASISIGMSDLRGIKEGIRFNIGKETYTVLPGSKNNVLPSGVSLQPKNLKEGEIMDFSFDLNLQGSQNLSFLPMGGVTEVKINSGWTSPSFNGSFLPDERSVTDNGFEATWKVLQLNRNYAQSWIGAIDIMRLNESRFGVDLILPLDDYQKSMRSAKYAVMTLALTFLVFFLVEILNNRKIHPLQYTLVGLGLCLFYVLLVSISEHSNFNFAYAISTTAIVMMISLYSLTILKRKKTTLTLTGILIAIYGFVFVTLQLADYALLLGSVGLTIILGLTMYFTRKIDWYNLQKEKE